MLRAGSLATLVVDDMGQSCDVLLYVSNEFIIDRL